MIKIDIGIGDKYGRLTILKEGEREGYYKQVICRCDCGKETSVGFQNLKRGNTQSCGCLELELKQNRKPTLRHGLYKHRLYSIWNSMMSRCYKENNVGYKHYGGRGITVAKRWHDVSLFIKDMDASYKSGLTIERKNVNGEYSKDNCIRDTYGKQANNKTNTRYYNINGEDYTLQQLSDKHNIPYHRLYLRIFRSGWTIEEAIGLKDKGEARGKYKRKKFLLDNIQVEGL